MRISVGDKMSLTENMDKKRGQKRAKIYRKYIENIPVFFVFIVYNENMCITILVKNNELQNILR